MGYVGEYRPEYYQGNPWHPKLFLEGEIDTLPYEHDSVVLYSGISNHEFFSREHSFDNSKSILENRLITPTNVHYQDSEVGSYDEFSSKQPATYMGVLGAARLHALMNEHPETRKTYDRAESSEGVVLELQVPTKSKTKGTTNPLWTLMAKKPLKLLKLKRKGNTHNYNPFSNLEELRRGLGVFGNNIEGFGKSNVENFRRLIQKASQPVDPSRNGVMSTIQIVHWATQYPVNIDNITGVWDVNFNSKEPNFESLEEYVVHQKEKYPEKMPEKSSYYESEGSSLNNSKIKKGIEEELEEIEKLEMLYGELIDYYIDIWQLIDDYNKLENMRKSKKIRKEILEEMEGYIQTREQMIDILDNNDINVDTEEWNRSYSQLITYPGTEYKYLKSFRDDLVEALDKEKNHLYNNTWDRDSAKKEIEFEQIVDEKLAEHVVKIPSLRPAYEQIKDEPPNWLRSYIVKKMNIDPGNLSLKNPFRKLKGLKKSLN